ncbi:ribonuclease H-like domain-containing protein [Tanacetum coccineum]|uniref:Ribonuclease H-like domain-containing protein n=1 Tax=Tanacetum coccineum TaxID=301880 RepID=A0ABQ5DDX8_9ASTR
MFTRAQVGTVKPNPRFNFHTSHISPLPKSFSIALSDPNWLVAMYDEYNTLVKNSTCMFVSKPPNANVFRSMSPVVKPATIRTILSLALSRGWHVHHFDVKNDFLNGDISETAYIYKPLGFVDSRFLHHVCQLQRSLYGLKQAHCAWLQRFASYALRAYKEADEIYAQMSLLPVNSDFSMQPPTQELIVRDLHDNTWTFRHIYRGKPKRHLLTTGWSTFVGVKRLETRNVVLFIRDEKSQLLLGVRRANHQQTSLPSSVLYADSMHIGVLLLYSTIPGNRHIQMIHANQR